MSIILDGKTTSNQIKEELSVQVKGIKEAGKRPPHLAAVLVGNDGASLTYVGSKVRSCEKIGYDSTLIHLEDNNEILFCFFGFFNKDLILSLVIN